MATKLIFNIDEIDAMITKVTETKTSIETSKTNLNNALTSLKTTWKTDAGKKFINDIESSANNMSWNSQAENAVKTLDEVLELLGIAKARYQEVIDEAANLNLNC